MGTGASRNVATTTDVLSNTGQGSEVTMTSGYASGPTGRLAMRRSGPIANITVYDPLTGTSNANTLAMTITQPEFMPASACSVPCIVEDNGVASVPAIASFGAPSTYVGGVFSAVVPIGSISVTLGANWTGATGVFQMNFSDGEIRPVNLTNGETTCEWVVPTVGASNTGYAVQCCVVTFAIATSFNAYSATGFTTSGTKGLNSGTSITYSL
jgi:hypothetical protein